QRRHALAPPRGRDGARRVARAGPLSAGRRDAAGAVRRRRPRPQPQSGEDRVTRDVAWARSAPAGAVRELMLSTIFRGLIAPYPRRTVRGPAAPPGHR